MPYITREDGERFIIPAYRDVLSAKKPALLKKEILLLAANYGEYITLQKKGTFQYEVAFSPEPGVLLGESVWHYFKRPRDLIYCEAIPNTSEVILVIVKSGSVYLDGSFPADSVPEELIVFQTQQNNFEIYVYGDVPISETLETGKFAFDSSSVKSFKVLDKPVFPTMPVIKAFQLQLVDAVLRQQGIGVFPVRNILFLLILAGALWYGWKFINRPKVVTTVAEAPPPNPYANYFQEMTTPDPTSEIQYVTDQIALLLSIPGWVPSTIHYGNGILSVGVRSLGARTNTLFDWAKLNHATVAVTEKGIFLTMQTSFPNRSTPTSISYLTEVIAHTIDKVSYVLPGNVLRIDKIVDKEKYKETTVTISVNNITPETFNLLGKELQAIPLVLSSVDINVNKGTLSGTIILNALGN